jgi:protein-disulfide isomerase
MNTDATNQFPKMPGTPTFVINGEMVEGAASWASLEPKIKEALK